MEQAEHKVGLACTGRALEQNGVVTVRTKPGGARGVQAMIGGSGKFWA